MDEQMIKRDNFRVGKIRKPPRQLVVEFEFAFLDQLQDHHRGERLARAGPIENLRRSFPRNWLANTRRTPKFFARDAHRGGHGGSFGGNQRLRQSFFQARDCTCIQRTSEGSRNLRKNAGRWMGM